MPIWVASMQNSDWFERICLPSAPVRPASEGKLDRGSLGPYERTIPVSASAVIAGPRRDRPDAPDVWLSPGLTQAILRCVGAKRDVVHGLTRFLFGGRPRRQHDDAIGKRYSLSLYG